MTEIVPHLVVLNLLVFFLIYLHALIISDLVTFLFRTLQWTPSAPGMILVQPGCSKYVPGAC